MNSITIKSLNKESLDDLLRVQDHKEIIAEQIQAGESLNQIEEYINRVEDAFQVELHKTKLLLAMSIYNQDPNQFNKLLPFIKTEVNRVLASKSNNPFFVPTRNDLNGISNMLDQVKEMETFNLQLDTLKYGNPLISSILCEAKSFQSKINK
jgi:DNA repair exonuclease SbcCD ATPase subunit